MDAKSAVIYLARIAVLAYVAWVALLYLSQNKILFPGTARNAGRLDVFPDDFQKVHIVNAERQTIEGFFSRPEPAANGSSPAVIYFHGNGETIYDCIYYEEIEWYIANNFVVLIPEYRGYSGSEGRPSEAGIAADMLLFYDWLAAQPGINRQRIAFHGRSLGGGVSANLALNRPPAALVLESTFASVLEMSRKYAVPGLLVRNKFRTDLAISKLNCPILITHGARDSLIPVSHGRKLHRLAPHSVYIETDADHNDRPSDWNAYWGQITSFLNQALQD